VEVKIGVLHAPRELVVETDATAESVEQQLEQAVSGDGVLALTDSKGRRIVVPATNIAYVEIGSGTSGTVGFR
jgi:hypothetical protein